MPSEITTEAARDTANIREAVCVHTNKIFDSCRDKDCLEDLRVYLTQNSLAALDNAVTIRARSAEIIHASADVEPVSFNKGYYTIDIRFFYYIRGEAYTLSNSSQPISGISVFDKRVLLYGSESSAKIFKSTDSALGFVPTFRCSGQLPTAVVEAVEPIVLDMRVVESCPVISCECSSVEIPQWISGMFDSPLTFDNSPRRVYVSLGQFSIVRLERDSQLLMPVYDYCVPDKECVGSGDDDPCALFSRIDFPVDDFFPPDSLTACESYKDIINTQN